MTRRQDEMRLPERGKLCQIAANCGNSGTGWHDRRRQCQIQTRRPEDFSTPFVPAQCNQLGMRGVRIFCYGPPSQPMGDVFGEIEPARPWVKPSLSIGEELIERIDLDELDARRRVDLLARHTLEDGLHHAVVARVAVMIGILEQVAALPDERVVDAPRVDAEAGEPRAAAAVQHARHLEPEPEDVPLERAVRADRFVRKPRDLVEGQHVPAERARDGAAALGTEIEGEKHSGHDSCAIGRVQATAADAAPTVSH